MLAHRRFAAFVSIVVAIAALSAASPSEQVLTGCQAGPGEPTLAQLQGWVREYYPGFVTTTKSSGRVAVGFALDAQCTVLRHGAAFLPDSGYSEDLVMTVFPDIHRTHERAGIGDGVSPRATKDGKRDQHVVVTYIVLPR